MIRAYSSWKSKYLHLSFNKWPSLQYKFQVSLVLWNHNNGEDCWLGNGSEDNHWHPPQSHRGSLLKGVAVHRVLYQSILNAKLTGRKKLGRKRCTSNRDDCKLENTVKQSWFKHLWELHKEWTEAGVSASRVTTLRRLQEKGYQATSEPETTSEASYLGCGEKELSGPKSSFQIKVNFAFHLEIKVCSLEEDWRGTESKLLEVQCEVSEVSDDLGCHDVCWCWSIVFHQVQSQCSRLPGNFGAFYVSICWQALWRCWFPFAAGI